MAENFLDNVVYAGSTLAVSGDAIAIGSTNAGAKSIIFATSNTVGHLAWLPTAARTINLPDAGGTVMLTSQAILSLSAGGARITSGEVVFSNSNSVSFGVNGQTVTASFSQTAQTQNNIQAVYDGANSISTGTIRFTNANGVSFSVNGQTVSASIATSLTAVNLSAGTTSNNLSAFVFSNSNNVSFGLNGSTVTATISVPAQTNQTLGLFATSNTTQNSSTTLDARSLTIQGVGGLSVGFSNGSIVLSGGAGGGGITNVNLSAGTTSNNLSAFVFSNSNNVSFGLNGSTVTATISVPAQTNQTVGLYALGNTTQNSSTTLDARTISFNGLGAATVGYSNGSVQISVPVQTAQTQSNIQAIYDGANSISTGTLRFTNANGVSFSINGQTISGSVSAQSNQTEGLYAIGNTTGQSSSSTFDARTLSVSGAGIASVGYSGNALVISVPAGAPSPVNFSAGTTSGNLGSVVFSNSNGISFGLNGSTITASVAGGGVNTYFATGNTTQNSTTTLNQSSVLFNALGAMTMGFSNGSIQVSAPPVTSIVGTGGIIISTNGSTLSISGPNYAYYEPTMLLVSGSTTFLPALGSLYFEPLTVPANISGGHINRLVSFSGTTGILPGSSASFNSGSTGSRSLSLSYVNTIALYSLGAGTNSTRLESLWSNTFSLGIAQSQSVSSGGATSLTVTHAGTMSYIASIDAAGAYTTSSVSGSTTRSTAASTMSVSAVTGGISSILNMLSGPWVMPIGFNTTIQPGNYWVAHVYSSSITTGGTSVVTASVLSQVNMIGLQAAATLSHHIWGQTVSTSGSVPYPGAGVYSAATNGIPSTVAFSDIRNFAAVRQYFNFVNSTI